jgi:hypothetical protein
MQGLKDGSTSIFFIHYPVATEEMCDGVQDVHPKTISLCIVVEHSSKKQSIPTVFRDMLEEIMECWTRLTPLHVKISAWHMLRGDKLPCALENLKKVLKPR